LDRRWRCSSPKANWSTFTTSAGAFCIRAIRFRPLTPTHQIGYTVDEWLARLEGLLRSHRIQLVNGALWLVNMPESGNAHVTTAVPSNM
jgi:hypothetical protein